MQNKTGAKQPANYIQKQTNETLKDFGSSMIKNTASSFKRIGAGIFDQLTGYQSPEDNQFENEFYAQRETKTSSMPTRKEFTVFNYQEYYEREVIKKQIFELTAQIKQEIELIKKADQSLLAQAKDAQKLVIDSFPDKPGIYHIRFLEIILNLLRTLRAKIGESKTWLQAMISKRKKRGSLFAVLSKKKGTQYSLSQELQTARSVQ